MAGSRNKKTSTFALEAEILALHAAIDHEGLWRGVLGILRKALPVHRITLFLGHLGLAEARVVFTFPQIVETEEWYLERSRLNPFSPYIARNIGRPYYHFHEVVGPPEVFRKTEFYKRFAKTEGWDKGLSVMFWNREEMLAMFSLYRSPGDGDFTVSEREAVLDLARHIEIAIIRVQKINREENFRSALQAFSRTIPAPILLLDWDLETVFANLAAYESAAIWNLGRDKAASLNPRDCFRIPTAILKAVNRLKGQFTERREGTGSRRLPDQVTLRHPQMPELQVRINPTHYSPSPLARPGFVVLFHAPLDFTDEGGPDSRERFRQRALQALTPAERKVAAEVCLGKRNEEIATALNKSTLTVKTQLNSIFQKLGFRSRGELIARLK
jgi:DNA-binding CsgD family transcriptional regulator